MRTQQEDDPGSSPLPDLDRGLPSLQNCEFLLFISPLVSGILLHQPEWTKTSQNSSSEGFLVGEHASFLRRFRTPVSFSFHEYKGYWEMRSLDEQMHPKYNSALASSASLAPAHSSRCLQSLTAALPGCSCKLSRKVEPDHYQNMQHGSWAPPATVGMMFSPHQPGLCSPPGFPKLSNISSKHAI